MRSSISKFSTAVVSLFALLAIVFALCPSVAHADDTAVAKIGDTSYTSMADAAAAVKDGETITLLKDVSESTKFATSGRSAKSITLDLNGHTLSSSGSYIYAIDTENYISLTIKDSNGGGKILSTKTSVGVAVYLSNNSTVTLEGGTLQGTRSGLYLSVGGGYYLNPSVAVVKGGTAVGGEAGVYMSSGTSEPYASLTVSGGEISGPVAIKNTASNPNVPNQLAITGGTFTSTDTAATADVADEGLTKFVSGGVFSKDVPAAQLADGYVAVKQSDDKYHVLPAVEKPTAATNLVYNGEQQAGVTGTASAYTLTGDSTATNAGTYTATASLKDKTATAWADGTTDDVTIEWSIAKKPVTIKVADVTMTVGDKVPALTGTVDGVVGSDDLDVVYVLADGVDLSKAGTYKILATYRVNDNYSVSVTDGKLTVSEKASPSNSGSSTTTTTTTTKKASTSAQTGDSDLPGAAAVLILTAFGTAAFAYRKVRTTR